MAKARIHTRVEDSTLRASKLLATHIGITYGELMRRALDRYILNWAAQHETGTNGDSGIAKLLIGEVYSSEE